MKNIQKIAVFGATSAIAAAVCRELAAKKVEFFLFGRHNQKLDAIKQDLLARGAASVESMAADLSVIEDHQSLVEQAWNKMCAFDTALIAYGTLPEQSKSEEDFALAEREIRINFTSVASLSFQIAKYLEKKGSGTLAVISSVAGDRGRQSNYLYGSAKGGLSIFLAGLRNRLFSKGIDVLTIKPGFVDTPMTAQFKKGPLFASAEQVASGIVKAIERRKNVVYLPWFWGPIMFVIRSIPECIFKRLKL